MVAQEDNSKVLIDSIIKISFNNDRVGLIDDGSRMFSNHKELDPFLAEASTYFWQQQMLVPYFAEIYVNFTEDELKEILAFYNSESYRRISSPNLQEELRIMFAVNMLGSLFAGISGQSWNLNDLKISDKEYNSLANKYIKQIKFEENFDAVLDVLLNSMQEKSSAEDLRMIKGMLTKMGKEGMACYKYLLGRYVSKKQLQEVVKFYSSSLGIRLLDNNVGNMISLFSDVTQNQESRAKFEAKMDSVVSVKDCLSYIKIAKQMSLANRNFSLPIDTIHLNGKSIYVGEVFGGLPGGKGVLTDKDGVRYSGDFKDGKRHGLLTTYFVNGDSISQYWADDKVMKNQGDDINKLVPSYMGKAMGYGKLSSGKACGYFVDGELHGKGEEVDANFTKAGLFKHGELISGKEVTFFDNKKKVVVFDKEVDGVITKGVKSIIKSGVKGQTEEKFEGTFIRDVLHGMGTYEYITPTFKSKYQGFFAYNELYGYGTSYKYWEENQTMETYVGNYFASKYQDYGIHQYVYTSKDSIKYVQITKGYFEKGEKEGDVEYEEKITKIPSAGWIFTRFGVRFANQHDTLTIHIKGVVHDKKLEGQAEIKASNGDYYKGVFHRGGFKEGIACIHYSDGSKYEGEFKDGKYNGNGKYYYLDGTYDDGIFLNGYIKEGFLKNKKGVRIKKIKQ